VLLGVTEADLLLWEEELKLRGITCEAFVEPDIGNQKTALAVHPSADGKLFRGIPLL